MGLRPLLANTAGQIYPVQVTVSPRPDITPARTRIEYVLDMIALLAVVFALAIVADAWEALPERVPRHFNAAGEPDAYGSKASVLIPALTALVLYVVLSLAQRVRPRRYNYPLRITEDNAAVQYRLARLYLAVTKAAVIILLASGTWLTIQVALGHRQGLGGWYLPAFLGTVTLTMVGYGIAAYRRRRG